MNPIRMQSDHIGRILKLADVWGKLFLLFIQISGLVLRPYQGVDTEKRLDLPCFLVVLQKSLGLQTYELPGVCEESIIDQNKIVTKLQSYRNSMQWGPCARMQIKVH